MEFGGGNVKRRERRVRRSARICAPHIGSVPVNLLAIETSAEYCSLALASGERLFARHANAGQRHAEMILTSLDELLREARLTLDEIAGIAYGEGPGSFTGLRIACGVAQGLALPRGIRVIGVSTLLALAEQSGENQVIACLDARMGEVYHAAYRKASGGWREVNAPGLHRPDAIPRVEGEGWVGCGSGFAAFGEVLGRRLGAALLRVRGEVAASAAAVLRIATPRFEAGEGDDPALALPLYLRDKVALKTSER